MFVPRFSNNLEVHRIDLDRFGYKFESVGDLMAQVFIQRATLPFLSLQRTDAGIVMTHFAIIPKNDANAYEEFGFFYIHIALNFVDPLNRITVAPANYAFSGQKFDQNGEFLQQVKILYL